MKIFNQTLKSQKLFPFEELSFAVSGISIIRKKSKKKKKAKRRKKRKKKGKERYFNRKSMKNYH